MSSDRQAPELEEELAPVDDAVIGKAFRISNIAFAVIGSAPAVIVWVSQTEEPVEVVREKDAGAIQDLISDVAVLPEVRFSDITEAAGITFEHVNGARGEKLLPETMGGGAAFFDYDVDGDQDLFFVGGMPWPHGVEAGAEARGRHALYENDGQGRFTDVTAQRGLDLRNYGMGCAVADYDGDGRTDLFITAVGRNALYRNTDAGFVDVTQTAGVGGTDEQWTTSAGFFDCDRDGDLDLFVCNYVKWSREIDTALAYTINGTDPGYGPPTSYGGSFSFLYRNNGDGTFSDVSAEAGIQITNPSTGEPMGKALGVAFADFDHDHLPDVVVANDTVQNHLFHNQGDGTFAEVGSTSGIGFDGNGRATGAMGIDIGDFRNDGETGVCIANFANEMTSLFVSRRGGLRFSDDAMGEGIGSPSRQRLSFGLFFFDYDLDGRLDLLQVNGHLEESIAQVQPSQTYLQPPQLFWNAGPDQRSCFMEVPPETAGDLVRQYAGRGSCYADIDGDGDLDVLLVQVGARPALLRNDSELGNHWLRVRLLQPGQNPNALGASVKLTVAGKSMQRHVTTTRSYLSQSERTLTFGLGTHASIEGLEVTWPDGATQVVEAPTQVDQEILIERRP